MRGQACPLILNRASSAGLGMRLIRALAKQTGAQLCVERHLPGTEFILEIPLDTSDATAAG